MFSRASRFAFFVVFAVCAFARPAQAVDLEALVGANFFRPSYNPDLPIGTSAKTHASATYGLLSVFSLGGSYEFETGFIRLGRTETLESASSTTRSSFGSLLLPMNFRFMRADFLGFGFGPYLAFPDDDENPNRKGSEFGVRASLRGEIPFSGTWKAVVDIAYQFAFTDSDKRGGIETKSQEFSVLAGVRVPIGETKRIEVETPSTGAKP